MEEGAESGYARRKIPRAYAESSMSYWWPKVRDLDVPQPRTIRIPVDEAALIVMLDGGPAPNLRRMGAAVAEIGLPAFLRNNVTSAKHDWRESCYLEDASDLQGHVRAVTDYTYAASMGEAAVDAMFVREFLKLERAGFEAFRGMPVTREVRCFLRNGTTECVHPYWFDAVFEREIEAGTSSRFRTERAGDDAADAEAVGTRLFGRGWRGKLARMNKLSESDAAAIHANLSVVAPYFDGYWSVDLAKGENGTWYLLDMARGEVSFHMPGCGRRSGGQ